LYSPGFPISVLIVNVLGSFLMGFFVVAFLQRGDEMMNPFLVTGLLGGFTTFSAFSLEAVNLFERGAVSQGTAYIGMSVIFSIAGLIFGSMLARVMWP
jgi:CrcB protein